MTVSIITATIPGREKMLAECVLSVRSQSHRDYEHIILLDNDRDGCSTIVNRAVAQAEGEWLFLIADDDLLLPFCLETHLEHSTAADIVYSPPLVWGLHDPWWYFQAPPAIPSTALIRKSLFLELGGYDETAVREEDRGLWVKAMQAGASFARAPGPTWIYRIHDGNKSLAGQNMKVAA